MFKKLIVAVVAVAACATLSPAPTHALYGSCGNTEWVMGRENLEEGVYDQHGGPWTILWVEFNLVCLDDGRTLITEDREVGRWLEWTPTPRVEEKKPVTGAPMPVKPHGTVGDAPAPSIVPHP
jgi:hypothetical protein